MKWTHISMKEEEEEEEVWNIGGGRRSRRRKRRPFIEVDGEDQSDGKEYRVSQEVRPYFVA